MAKFDITAAFQAAVGAAGNVSKSDTSRETIEYISLDKLEADPGNFYSLTGLEDLAANIELCGLQQPIRVRPTEDGRYVIVSGHRRWSALKLLRGTEGSGDRWASIPCIVERYEASQELRELRLILANSSTRVLSPAEVSKQAQRVELLLYQLKEQGYEFPGRMRDQVAAACQVSAPKLARLKVIREHLIPIYLEHFDRNVLSEQTAYALARMETALQERLANMLPNLPTGSRAEELLELSKSGIDWRPTFSCPDGRPCTRKDAFLRHDLDCGYGELCKGETCCLRCPKAKTAYYACERMCSKAKAARKMQRDEEEAREAKREAELQAEIQKNVQLRAKRLAAAADAAGLENEASILISEYGRGLTVGKLRDWAAGHFDQDDRLYPSTLNARDFSDPVRLAKDLGCSTDYLLGVTDQLTPAALSTATDLETDGPWHWWPEQPQESDLYWCITGPMSHGGSLYWWNAEEEQWEHPAMAFQVVPSVRLILTTLSDASAALSLNESDNAVLIAGLSRMKLTDKTTQEYLNYFSERGIDVYEALSKWGDAAAVAEKVTRGEIRGSEAVEEILAYMQEQYGGLSEQMAGTYEGMVDNLADAEANAEAAYGEGYNEKRKEGIQAQMDWLNSGVMDEANRAIGAWQAELENTKEQYQREAVEAMMETDEYQQAQAEGDAAEMGRLIMQAKVQGMNEYNASEGAQLALESELALAAAIRDDASSNQAYWDAGYRKSQEYSKGLAAGMASALVGTGSETTTGLSVEERRYGNWRRGGYYDEDGVWRSHAAGLERVPYDGYAALLHEGERVLTAREARQADQGGGAQVTITGNTFEVRQESDIDAIAEALYWRLRLAQMGGVR